MGLFLGRPVIGESTTIPVAPIASMCRAKSMELSGPEAVTFHEHGNAARGGFHKMPRQFLALVFTQIQGLADVHGMSDERKSCSIRKLICLSKVS